VSKTLTSVVVALTLAAWPAEAAGAEPGGVVVSGGAPVVITEETATGFWVVTPCGRRMHVAAGPTISAATVVIDPGHGGPADLGAVSPSTGVAEKDLNLRVAREAVRRLRGRGVSAVLTRTGDYSSRLSVRAGVADALGATVMVSIHHNAPVPEPSDAPGAEVFVQNGEPDSIRLGGVVYDRVMAALEEFDVAWAAKDDAGVMTVLNSRGADAYGILRWPETPTALVELGYMANPAEALLHQSPEYVPTAGTAVAEAVTAFLNSDEQGAALSKGRIFNPQPGIGGAACVDPSRLVETAPGGPVPPLPPAPREDWPPPGSPRPE